MSQAGGSGHQHSCACTCTCMSYTHIYTYTQQHKHLYPYMYAHSLYTHTCLPYLHPCTHLHLCTYISAHTHTLCSQPHLTPGLRSGSSPCRACFWIQSRVALRDPKHLSAGSTFIHRNGRYGSFQKHRFLVPQKDEDEELMKQCQFPRSWIPFL